MRLCDLSSGIGRGVGACLEATRLASSCDGGGVGVSVRWFAS